MKYKAVIFDLFGTLVNMYPWTESNNVLRQMAEHLTIPPEEFIDFWLVTFNERMTGTFRKYEDCIKYISQQAGVAAQEEQIELAANLRNVMSERELASTREGALEVLSYLKSNDYKTGLISDCSTIIPEIWDTTPLAPFIDVAVFSCIEGIKKPDERIYRTATTRLGVETEECLYIADGIGQELTTAAKLGMYAVMIRTPDDRTDDPYRESWDGPVIKSLNDIPKIISEEDTK